MIFFEKKVNCGKPFDMSLDNVVNICQIIRPSRDKNRILLHAVSSGDKVFKTIGPRSAMMKWWSLSRSTLLNTPIVCLNVFFDS